MTTARERLISLKDTTYYHCISRCVRRAFLCGEDHFSGQSYEHRKDWVLERLRELDKIFAIDICAYAVMSNHYHLVLRVDIDKAKGWDKVTLICQWKMLFKLPVLVERYQRGECTTQAEQVAVNKILKKWRKRLMDISWYMRCLNEHLARRANEEDCCTGRFWEGRFKSQALLDEAAVLTCMSYVDLNPIRAKMASTPENSDYTSIQQRICQWNKTQLAKDILTTPPPELMPLVQQHRDPHQHSIGFTLTDYIELVDWVGRQIRENKRGYIESGEPPVLQRLGIDSYEFVEHMKGKHKEHYPKLMGRVDKIQKAYKSLEQSFIKGLYQSRLLYSG
ncbi:MAG: transposase [Gammaproteobacteria bacterium]|nr:transposase [Gammaproteobacteria bacterium]